MSEKKTLNFPWWMEMLLVVLLLVMAPVEFRNGQWVWAMIFGVAGVGFGVSLGTRLISGDKHGGE